ncbi:uncharacterized protein LOC128555762 [Mercenaria mercenaria]|uniref:uncharacterized protein LOC128555762 n=1 Tax=Mercenaria mercenaria TaxID=6596 RepID=UPI00234F63BC|nr:uncharacterized protein LOC128555762 [Mercenaria mercenaria]
MATSEEEITRGHELYLRHLLLLGQAAPVGVKAVIEREVRKQYMGSLANLLAEKKDTFKAFPQLFQDDEVNADIDSWDIHLLCDVTLALFESCLTDTEREAILCISGQRKDLDNYADSASLSYKTFETKWAALHPAILGLIKNIDDETAKLECTRMIYSFKSESTRVNMELINRIKQTKDVNLHVQMAIQDKVAPKIHGD